MAIRVVGHVVAGANLGPANVAGALAHALDEVKGRLVLERRFSKSVCLAARLVFLLENCPIDHKDPLLAFFSDFPHHR